ncbi:MAG: hypothetical protein AAGC85_18995 [Bacteroidota bacterium]
MIRNNPFLFIPLILSLLFFLRKGVQYAMIGSYVPLVVIILPSVLMALTILQKRKTFLLLSKAWAIILIIWSVGRLFIASVNLAIPTFDEYHLNNQLGGFGFILSILMLSLGILILRNLKSTRIQSWQ